MHSPNSDLQQCVKYMHAVQALRQESYQGTEVSIVLLCSCLHDKTVRLYTLVDFIQTHKSFVQYLHTLA
jgi:hypothetical protein